MCQKPSVPGSPPPPEYPLIPVNEQCEPNWVWVPSSNKCIYHDLAFRAWNSAKENCRGMGGDLVSINSPETNEQVLAILMSFFYDPTASGTENMLLQEKIF